MLSFFEIFFVDSTTDKIVSASRSGGAVIYPGLKSAFTLLVGGAFLPSFHPEPVRFPRRPSKLQSPRKVQRCHAGAPKPSNLRVSSTARAGRPQKIHHDISTSSEI